MFLDSIGRPRLNIPEIMLKELEQTFDQHIAQMIAVVPLNYSLQYKFLLFLVSDPTSVDLLYKNISENIYNSVISTALVSK